MGIFSKRRRSVNTLYVPLRETGGALGEFWENYRYKRARAWLLGGRGTRWGGASWVRASLPSYLALLTRRDGLRPRF